MDVSSSPRVPRRLAPSADDVRRRQSLLFFAPAAGLRQREAKALMGSWVMVSVVKIANTITEALKKGLGAGGCCWAWGGEGVGGCW